MFLCLITPAVCSVHTHMLHGGVWAQCSKHKKAAPRGPWASGVTPTQTTSDTFRRERMPNAIAARGRRRLLAAAALPPRCAAGEEAVLLLLLPLAVLLRPAAAGASLQAASIYLRALRIRLASSSLFLLPRRWVPSCSTGRGGGKGSRVSAWSEGRERRSLPCSHCDIACT